MIALFYGQTFLSVTRNIMLSFHLSSQSPKTTRIAVAKLLLLFFCGVQDFRVSGIGSDQWIRLCTLMSNGSSLMNVTMPCGVQVGGNEPKDDYKNNIGVSESWREGDDSVEYVKISLDGGLNITSAEKHPENLISRQDVDSTTNHLNNKTSGGDREEGVVEEEGDVEEEVEEEVKEEVKEEEEEEEKEEVEEEEEDAEEEKYVEEERDEEKEEDAGTGSEDDNEDRDVEIESGDDDKSQSAYDEEVTILNVEANEGASEEIEDQLKNRRRGTAVTKVMLDYLLDARNQLYYKIHYLLNLLQRAFFNMELNCRHRRNSIERRSLFNNKRAKGNKKNPLFSSMILEPTFERSIMTMSFLMFGVFVIQVVQKLMQTIQQSGENSFLGNSIFGNLPTASSSLF